MEPIHDLIVNQHGSFGGPGMERDELYSAGSDDFRGYVWKIPRTSELVNNRKEVSADDWSSQDRPFTTGASEAYNVHIYVLTYST